MARRYELNFFIVYVFLIPGYSAIEAIPQKPEILSEFETIIEANDNHTVFCQGNKPLKWTTPYVEDAKYWTTFSQQPEEPTSPDYQYGSRLYITNMTYPFVGFYYCHHEDADIEDDNWSANIYLYVNDNLHLTTSDAGQSIETITVPQYQEATIPCKPTSPDVRVTLFQLTGEEVEDTSYDPKTGFTFFVSDLSQEQIYQCIFSRNSETNTVIIHLTIETLPVSHLAKPDLRDLSEGHTVVGDQLKLNCTIRTINGIQFHWSTPNSIDPSRLNISNQAQSRFDKISQILTVYNVTKEDGGIYFCNGTDNQGHSSSAALDVKIFGVDESFLNMTEPNGLYSIVVPAGEEFVQWSIDVQSHPIPTLEWLDHDNVSIPMGNGTKYEAYYNARSNQAFLKIKNISIVNMGYYKLVANNQKTRNILSLFLNVTDRPSSLRIETDLLHTINTPSTVKCHTYANPEPKFHWEYKNCQNDDCSFIPINSTVTKVDSFEFISETIINASTSGIVKCSAINDKGYDEAITKFNVSDIENGFDIFGLDSTVNLDEERMVATVALGDTIRVTCGASIYSYRNISWLINDQILQENSRYTISRNYTEYSMKIQLEIAEANRSDIGLYSCRVVGENGDFLFKNITFKVADPQHPIINSTNMRDEIEMNIPDELVMFCEVFGLPKPTMTWFKNGLVFNPSEPNRIQVEGNNERIIFKSTIDTDEGTYKCEARNRIGVASKKQSIKFKNLPKHQKWLIYVIAFLTLLSIAAIVFIVIRLRKEKKLQRELKKLGLANFVKGAVENINPELGIDDQAELLPYDRKWEFPIENLKLGKQLGSGAFGVVMKGEAKNIIEGEPVTTVAVKKVKKNADNTYIRALASELKVMVHLGKHLNVVNLLGACTKNVAKRELLVIVEYCRFGNLQNYLLRHRDNYINQIDPKTGLIDYTIGQEYFDRSYSVSSNRSDTQSPSLKYAALTFSNSSNSPVVLPVNSMGDYRENAQTASGATEMTTIPQDEGVVISNNSVQPEWRTNYKGDYKGNVKPICTKDLLAWAFQVARGMEYLASRKVLHGDLAARNILLADNNVVKICDFGLAKSMYKNDNYKKRGDGPLPVKWMAIESIRDRVFSTQSDVWSFGIVLWEFFSLARTPYPGMEANERLYQKLVDGYRMESPEYAPNEIYSMMTSCWAPKPLTRPSFAKLSEKIGGLLEDSLRKHYIDLNDPYLVMNTQRIESGESDYLAMLSPPTFEALCTPHYVNEKVQEDSSLEDSGYLSMKPNIFSPGLNEGQVFDFNIANRKHLDPEGANRSELLPMLRRPSESDCETPLPTTPNSFSNPSYLLPPKILEETDSNSDIVKSADNYVNMPQNKSFIKEKGNNISNPFANVNSEKNDVHYVNGNSRDWDSVQV